MTTAADYITETLSAELDGAITRSRKAKASIVAATGISESSLRRYLKGELVIPIDRFQAVVEFIGADPAKLYNAALQEAERMSVAADENEFKAPDLDRGHFRLAASERDDEATAPED